MGAGSGTPLPLAVKTMMEARLGHDWSQVRVHTGRRAAASAAELDAHAYTIGPHVVFGEGQFQPSTSAGQRLIGHELAHVAQQGFAHALNGGVAVTPGPTGLARKPIDPRVRLGQRVLSTEAKAAPFAAAASIASPGYTMDPANTLATSESLWGAQHGAYTRVRKILDELSFHPPANTTLYLASTAAASADGLTKLQVIANEEGWTIETLVVAGNGLEAEQKIEPQLEAPAAPPAGASPPPPGGAGGSVVKGIRVEPLAGGATKYTLAVGWSAEHAEWGTRATMAAVAGLSSYKDIDEQLKARGAWNPEKVGIAQFWHVGVGIVVEGRKITQVIAHGQVFQLASATPTPSAGVASGAATPGNADAISADIPEIPTRWLATPDSHDVIVVAHGDRAVLLPLSGLGYRLEVPAGAQSPTEGFFGVPTVGKEGLRLARVGAGIGMLLDAGGKPTILAPDAVAAIRRELDVTSIRSLTILHVHDDHVRNLTTFITSQGIRAENLRFPSAFEVPTLQIGRVIADLRTTTNAGLLALGYGRGAQTPFAVLQVPENVALVEHAWNEQAVRVETFGLGGALRRIVDRAAEGKSPRGEELDQASLLMRITHRETGVRALVLGDLRGRDIRALQQTMGAARFSELFEGVRILSGFQHHLGALNSDADREGLSLLLAEVSRHAGEITVVAQSQLAPYGRATYPFLNRSLAEALRQLGVDVAVATEMVGSTPGTIRVDAQGRVTTRGQGVTFTAGEASVTARRQRFQELAETIRVIEENQSVLRGTGGASVETTIGDMRAARQQLGERLGILPAAGAGKADGLIQRVLAGVGKKGAQANSSLTNQTDVDAQRQLVLQEHAGEAPFASPGFRDDVRHIEMQGPLLRSIQGGIAEMRRTGRVGSRLIEDLIELNPELAERLLRDARLPKKSRQALQRYFDGLKGAPSRGSRVVGGVLALVEIANLAAPVVANINASNKRKNIGKFAQIHDWWAAKSMSPEMEALHDGWGSAEVRVTDTASVAAMVNGTYTRDGDTVEADYLTLEKLPSDDASWDLFNLWAMTHIRNVQDYHTLIWRKPTPDARAIQFDGGKWKYRAGTIVSDTVGYSIDERWVEHPRLNTIMEAVLDQVATTTDTELSDAWKNREKWEPTPDTIGTGGYHNEPMLRRRRPLRRVRFGSDVGEDDREAYAVNGHRTVVEGDQWSLLGKEPVFYVVKHTGWESIDDKYALVVGADHATYRFLSRVRSVREEVESDGTTHVSVPRSDNPRGEVLIEKKFLVDF
ncbi:MAG: DUF4157 domain-containing protein [Myxococcales bacterium]|nr:DUF4157 domain-containing protein [Myxococcales bacterium]